MAPDPGKKLEGWKEIADHFHRNPRTIQLWEKSHSLPIHRFQKRVFAYTTELDSWKAANESVTQADFAEGPPSTPAPDAHDPNLTAAPIVRRAPTVRWWQLAAVSAATLLVTAGVVAAIRHYANPPRNPARIVLAGSTFRALDMAGTPLWELPVPILARDESPPEWLRRNSPLVDLDGDGFNEALLAFRHGEYAPNELHCYDHLGRPCWSKALRAGRRVANVHGTISSYDFNIDLVGVLNRPRADGGRIIIGAHRGPGSLYVVEVLDPTGRKVAEYFHPGWFFIVQVTDLDEDGFDEILLGGVNDARALHTNGAFHATLVILDSRRVEGQGWSPPGDVRQVKDIPMGREKAVVFFPEFAADLDPNDYCRPSDIMERDGRLDVRVYKPGSHHNAEYRFHKDLRIESITPDPRLLSWIDRSFGVADRTQVERLQTTREFLQRIDVLKNDFGPQSPSGSATASTPSASSSHR